MLTTLHFFSSFEWIFRKTLVNSTTLNIYTKLVCCLDTAKQIDTNLQSLLIRYSVYFHRSVVGV